MKPLSWLVGLFALPVAYAQDSMPLLFTAGFFLIWLCFMILMLAGWVLWIFMLIDCATRKNLQHNEKVLWIIILALTQILGAVIYYFVVKRAKKHSKS